MVGKEIEQMSKKAKSVIAGKRLSIGITISMLGIFILIPLASILIYSAKMSLTDIINLLNTKAIKNAFIVSFKCSLIAAFVNVVFGTMLAWVLVRYDFFGKRFMDGLIELPFALPTAVAGITLSNIYSNEGVIGKWFSGIGIDIAYTQYGITIALIFIGLPFVVRAVQPVLEKLDPQFEEASQILGANHIKTFTKVILPEILPSILTGFGLAFARGLGEYGSVVFISGNKPNETQVVPMMIMSKLNSGTPNYEAAAAIALVMLIIAFILLFIINIIQMRAVKFTKN